MCLTDDAKFLNPTATRPNKLKYHTPKQHGMPTQTTGMPKKSQVNTAATLSILHDIGVPEEEGD